MKIDFRKINMKLVFMVAFALLLVLALLVPYVNTNVSATGDGETYKGLTDRFKLFKFEEDGMDGDIFFVIAKVLTIAAVVCGFVILAIEAVRILDLGKLLGVDVYKYEKLIGQIMGLIGALILISMMVFFIASTETENISSYKMTEFLSGGVGWYLAWFCSFGLCATATTNE